MKHASPCLYSDADGPCLQVKNGPRHYGHDADHDYLGEKKAGFGSARAPLNPRSEKRERYYADHRVPAVKNAVGDGRRPCGLLHELDGTLREITPSPVCTGWVEGIHEVASRGRFGGLKAALKAGPTIDCCHACNRWWSEHSKEAEAAGLLMKNRGPTRTQNSWDARPLFDQDEEEA